MAEEETIIWSSENRFMADAMELRGEEGRDKLRKAGFRSTYPHEARMSEWGNPHAARHAPRG